jgi:competence protein ComEA
MPFFNRTQQGVVILLGAVLLLTLAWRHHFGRPFPPPPPPSGQVFVEVEGTATRSGVYAFATAPSLARILELAGKSGSAPPPTGTVANGSLVTFMPDGSYTVGRMRGARLVTLGLGVEVNRAAVEDLEALPGVGPALARRIVDYRRRHGPFQKLEDLEQVRGFGPKLLEKLRPYVLLSASPPPPDDD